MSTTLKYSMENAFRPAKTSEEQILERLFQWDFPGRDDLRLQMRGLMVRQLDDNGWLALRPTTEQRAVVRFRVPIEGSYPDADGVLVHVLLHVVDGRMCDLEVFKEDGSSVVCHPQPTALEIFCPTGEPI